MKTFWLTCTCALMLGGSAASQSSSGPTPLESLGERARLIREQKSDSAPKAKHVYDNTNLPKDPNAAWRANSRDSQTQDTAKSDKKDDKDAKDKDAKKDGKNVKTDDKDAKKDGKPVEDEQAWRGRFAKLRDNLSTEARRLDLLQRELNLAQIQSYSDPNQAMREQFARTELIKRTAEIEAQKQVVESAKKAIADLEAEARQKGVPAGWMTP